MWRVATQRCQTTVIVCWAVLIWPACLRSDRAKRIKPVPPELRQSFESSKNVAVVVGINAYGEDPELSSLKYARKDASLIASVLSAHKYQVELLLDSEATKERILREVMRVGRIEGTLIFFYSGHGGESNGENYLVTYGASSKDLEKSGLAISALEEALGTTGAKRQVLWIDACRSKVNKKSASNRSYERLEAASGQRALYSTGPGSSSWESDELQQGVFTHFLYRGLTGIAAGVDGLITMRDLADYVAQEVANFSKTQQVPYDGGGGGSGDFLIAGNITAGMAHRLGVSNLQAGVYPGANGAMIVSMELPAQAPPASQEKPGDIELVARAASGEFDIVKLIGSLPGVQATFSIAERDNVVSAVVLETPGPTNNWRRMRLLLRPESLTVPVRVVVHYEPPPLPVKSNKRK